MTAKAQASALLALTQAVAEAVRAAGPQGIPSGHVYAAVMGSVGLDAYQSLVKLLKGARLIEERNHLLTWVGPRFDEAGDRVMEPDPDSRYDERMNGDR